MLAGVQVAGAAATGLVHISEAADEYVKDLGQLFSPGQSAAAGLTLPYCRLCMLILIAGRVREGPGPALLAWPECGRSPHSALLRPVHVSCLRLGQYVMVV